VEWQRRYLGREIPDDAAEEAGLYRDGLEAAGHSARLVRWRPAEPAAMAEELRPPGAGLVFNASSLREVAFLEALGVPYCGSGLDVVALDKAARKKIWAYHGVPTAPFLVVDEDGRADGGRAVGLGQLRDGWTPPPPLDYPLFVKPVRGRGSSGVSEDSIVGDLGQLRRQAEMIVALLGQAALVETYLPGREVTVGLLGHPARALEPLEIEYNRSRTNTYEHKMDREIMHCPPRCGADERRLVLEAARAAYEAIGARDFGRVDIVLGPDRRPNVLELNTFAGLQMLTGRERHLHSSYMGVMARAMGLGQAELLGLIVDSARRRYGI
jgi:D-alanine-D-alanine ligase